MIPSSPEIPERVSRSGPQTRVAGGDPFYFNYPCSSVTFSEPVGNVTTATALQSETGYRIDVTGAVRDLQGYALVQSRSSAFTTRDTTPPPPPPAPRGC